MLSLLVAFVPRTSRARGHANARQSLVRFWPWRSSSKQVIFLNELEEVLELLVGPDQISEVEDQLFNLLARCISSEHFQVGGWLAWPYCISSTRSSVGFPLFAAAVAVAVAAAAAAAAVIVGCLLVVDVVFRCLCCVVVLL